MSVNVTALGIDQLTVAERLELIELLWDGLPDQVESADLPAWHIAELARRRAAADTNPGDGRNWRVVLDEIES